MPRDRLTSPNGIARGGFAGGVAGGAGRTVGSPLSELGDALSQFGNTFRSAAIQRSDLRVERVRRDTQVQKEEGEKTADEMLSNEMLGYTSKQIGEALNTDPIAEKLKANPYIMPAINIHRGRVAADEVFQQMTQDGVNIRDPSKVSEYMRSHTGDLGSDPFVARGFQEQHERNQAQLSQMQFKQALTQADNDRTAMAGREFSTVINDTADAVELTNEQRVGLAFEALSKVPGLQGFEATQIQMDYMRAAADRGDLSMVRALASTKRGSAPALQDDANVSSQVQTYLTHAETQWRQGREADQQDALFSLDKKTAAGITYPALMASPEMVMLRKEDPEKYGMAQRAWLSHQEQLKAKAASAASKGLRQQYRDQAAQQAAQFILAGRGEVIDDVDVELPDGTSYTVSGETAKRKGLDLLRNRIFPEGVLAIPDDHLENVREYTSRLADSNMKDDQLAGFLNGVGSYLTPEGMIHGGPDVAYGYSVYKHMDPSVANTYITDAKSRAVFSKMDELMQRDPSLKPEQAATRAVTITAEKQPELGQKAFKGAFKDLKVTDPINNDDKFLFFFGGDSKKVAPEMDSAKLWATERYQEYRAAGMGHEAALKKSSDDFTAEHTIVNGSVVALPNGASSDPQKSRETPQGWARKATDALKYAAGTDDIKGYSMTSVGDNAYIILKPNGEQTYTTAEGIRRAASTYADKQQIKQGIVRYGAAQTAADKAKAKR